MTSNQSKLAMLVAINPFAGLIAAITHPRDINSRNLVWVFTIFYGAVFFISESSGSDSVRYADELRQMYEQQVTFAEFTQRFFGGVHTYQDFYQPVITFLVSRITGESWLLFGLFGVLLGYVYSRNIWLLLDQSKGPVSLPVAVYVVAFALDVAIGPSLNGVRMWTALHVFLFGVLHFSATNDKKFLLIAILTPLIHFSFILPCAFLGLFFLVRRFEIAIFGFFLASFVVSNVEIEIVRQLLSFLPLSFEEHAVVGYVDRAEPAMEQSGAGGGPIWFLTLNSTFMTMFVLLSAVLIFVRGLYRKSGFARDVFLFGMFSYGLVNVIEYIPSAGRFYNIGQMLVVAALVILLSDSNWITRKDRQRIILLSPLLAINIALGVRFLLEYASIYLVIGNFFIAPFVDAQFGLYEMVESLI